MAYLIQHPPGTYANQMAFLPQQTLHQTLTPSGHTHLSTPATVMTGGNNISQMLQSIQQVNPSYNNDSCIIIVIVDIFNTASSRDLCQPDGILTTADSSDIDSIRYTFNRGSFESVTNGQSE